MAASSSKPSIASEPVVLPSCVHAASWYLPRYMGAAHFTENGCNGVPEAPPTLTTELVLRRRTTAGAGRLEDGEPDAQRV